ncbi:MAG: hypothetical protein JW849_00625, partial [Phycisphaerae bacterium]|nr:hypothetical protein [Phycisphaerae bacterium]
DSPAVLSALLKALRGVRLNGALELKEPQALISPVLRTPETLEISGAWSGPWSFLPGENPKFTLGLRGGPEAVLRIADAFAKPAGRELSLELSGVIDPDTRSIAHVLLDVLSGQGRVSLEETTIRLPEKDQPLRAEGELEAERIEAFGDWASGDWRKHPPISGDVKGAFGGVWEASAGKAEVHVEADLAALAVSAGEVFTKPAGQRADLNIHARHRFRENAGAATLAVDLEGGTFQVDSEYDKGVVSASVLADIQYLSWLHASSPLLHRALDGGRLAGTLRAEGSARWDGRSLLYTAKANSEKLDCRIGEKSPLVNLRGKRVALAIQGSMKDESPEIRLWNVEKTSLAVDESSIAICDLKTRWRREEPRAAGGKTRPWDACRELSARVQIVGDAGDLLGEVFPKWASWAGQHKLVGKIHTDGTLQMDRKSLSAALRVDAGDLGVQNVEGFAKPQGQPAVAHLDVTTPRDFSAPQLRRLAIKTHAVQLDAQVRGKARLSDAGLPIGIEPTEAQIRAELKNAAELASFWPAMKEHNLTGRAKVALDWTAGPDKLGTISEFTLKADDLRGTYRGKSCRLDGDVYVKALRLADDKTLHVERAVTENLEFAAGDNHGWLLADVQLAPGAPKGTFHLLLESLDEKDLADWLAEPEAASAPASAPADRTDADLALQRRSEQLLGRLREWFHDADLTGRVSAARWRTYDANVKQSYPTRELEASLRVKDNTVHAHYDASLYGGRVSGRMDTNLTVPKPVVTGHAEQVDVKATKTIQPQISRQFPGNTVSGRISQTKDVHFPLRDLLCSVLDNQYRLCPEGTGRLIATDGLLVGKAAPDFVTKIFPGLNLTKYPYRTMTTFMKLLPDGTAENETFLFGAYDLYMEGVTKRDYTIQYTIGLVLMGGAFPPEALRDWKQGRIPILKMKGRIEDGTLMDDEVSYPLPNETLFEIFLKNNLVYRAWVNLQAASAGK